MDKPRLTFKEFHTPSSGLFFEVEDILVSKESEYQNLLLFKNGFWGKVFVLDGLVMSTEKDEFFYHESLVHPPMVLSESIKNILLIGGGDGGSLREILKYDVDRVLVAEIDKEVVRLAYEYLGMEKYFEDDKVSVRIEDGLKVVKEGGQWDVIIVDSTDPVGPAKVLFGEDFIKAIHDCIDLGGVACMQVGNPLFYSTQIKEVYDLASRYFSYVRLYAGFTPTYPGGFWTYILMSKGVRDIRRKLPENNRFLVSEDVLKGLFLFEDFIKSYCEIP